MPKTARSITHENAHDRPDDLDPRKNGPFLDDIREEQLNSYRQARMKATQEKKPKLKSVAGGKTTKARTTTKKAARKTAKKSGK